MHSLYHQLLEYVQKQIGMTAGGEEGSWMEPVEKCHFSKENSLRGLASEQSQTLFAVAIY